MSWRGAPKLVPPSPGNIAVGLDCARPNMRTAAQLGGPFQSGRRPFDASAPPTWHALFESFALTERLLGPVFRQLLRNRGAKLSGPPTGAYSEDAMEARLFAGIRASPQVWMPGS